MHNRQQVFQALRARTAGAMRAAARRLAAAICSAADTVEGREAVQRRYVMAEKAVLEALRAKLFPYPVADSSLSSQPCGETLRAAAARSPQSRRFDPEALDARQPQRPASASARR